MASNTFIRHEPHSPAFYSPSQTALLLLDYHNFLVNTVQPAGKRQQLISAVKDLLRAAREGSVPIFHCLIDVGGEAPQSSKMKERWDTAFKPMVSSSPEALAEWKDFKPEAYPPHANENETTVVKVPGCVSALKSQDLVHLLEVKHKSKSVIIYGLVTSGAVLSTARDAADLGFVSTVVRDACWDPSSDAHQVILDNVLSLTSWVLGVSEAADILRGIGRVN